jgi:hypothetical protein
MPEGKEIKVKLPKISIWAVSTLILLIVLAVSLYKGFGITGRVVEGLTEEQAAQKAIDYVNNNLVSQGAVSLVEIKDLGSVYEITGSYQGQQVPIYITKDGSYIFLQAFDTSQELPKPEESEEQPEASCEDLPKEDKPVLQAFVVSYCPFGSQMQRILVEVSEILEDYIEVRYIGSVQDGKVVAMHGEEEATENLRQICIREEQEDKYWDYVACFIKKGETESCLGSAGIDQTSLEECMEDPSKGVEYAKEDFDLQGAYGVTGSPTLILNGERVSEFDFGGRSAEAVKTVLCCGFEEEPDVCSQELETEQAARGFSESYSSSGGSSGGQC